MTNVGAANDFDVTIEDLQGLVRGGRTNRGDRASGLRRGNVARALGLAIAVADEHRSPRAGRCPAIAISEERALATRVGAYAYRCQVDATGAAVAGACDHRKPVDGQGWPAHGRPRPLNWRHPIAALQALPRPLLVPACPTTHARDAVRQSPGRAVSDVLEVCGGAVFESVLAAWLVDAGELVVGEPALAVFDGGDGLVECLADQRM